MTMAVEILPQKYPNKAFLVCNLGIFVVFFLNSNQTNLRMLILNMTIVVKILPQKYSNKVFLVFNLGIFLKFSIRQI